MKVTHVVGPIHHVPSMPPKQSKTYHPISLFSVYVQSPRILQCKKKTTDVVFQDRFYHALHLFPLKIRSLGLSYCTMGPKCPQEKPSTAFWLLQAVRDNGLRQDTQVHLGLDDVCLKNCTHASSISSMHSAVAVGLNVLDYRYKTWSTGAQIDARLKHGWKL